MNEPIKVLLIMPEARIHRVGLGGFKRSMREAPLTLTTLAALTPDEMKVQLRLVDENVEKLPEDIEADLVAISVITGTAPRAYALARRFRSRGIPVVLGGVHVTILPEEAQLHADCIVVGPAEETWPKLLEDFSHGNLSRRYESRSSGLDEVLTVPSPRRDLQRRFRYNVPDTVMATRGCLHKCEFCSVPVAWPGYQRRPVQAVIEDIRKTKGRYITFNDVSLTDDRVYIKELLQEMITVGKKWGGLATTDIGRDPELMDLMAESGCRYLLIGFESVDRHSLRQVGKSFNRETEYKALMAALHERNISVQGCFMFGFENDEISVFKKTVQWVTELKIDIPRYSILTPYPGTRLFKKLYGEGRILSFNWEDYDTMHVVFQPARMTPDELYNGFKWIYRETFRTGRIMGRVRSINLAGLINGVGNLTYKKFAKKLEKDAVYSEPYTRQTSLTEKQLF